MLQHIQNSVRRPVLPWLVGFLFASAIYLFAFPQPNVVYPAIVLFHVLVGAIGIFFFVPALVRCVRSRSIASLGWVLMLAGAAVGLLLIYTGTPRSDWKWLYAHIVLCTAAVGVLAAKWAERRGW